MLEDDALREAYALQLRALRSLRREIARRERVFENIMARVRENDEAVANFGQDCGILSAPSDHPVATAPMRVPRERRLNERREQCTHDCYVPPEDVDLIERCGE